MFCGVSEKHWAAWAPYLQLFLYYLEGDLSKDAAVGQCELEQFLTAHASLMQ